MPTYTLPLLVLLSSSLALSSPASARQEELTSYPPVRLVQAWDPEVGEKGSWLIKALEVDSFPPARCTPLNRYSSEEVIYLAASDAVFRNGGLERAEGEWVENESGEGMEEAWARAWASTGSCLLGSESSSPTDVPAFFSLAHRVHQELSTYTLLDDSDISPSEDISYSLSEMVDAIQAKTGYVPHLECAEDSSLKSISYPLSLSGAREAIAFAPREPSSSAPASNCPSSGIIYHPSLLSIRPSKNPQPTHTWDPIFRPSPRPITLTATPAAEPTEQLGFIFGQMGNRDKEKEEKVMDSAVWGKRDRDEL